MWAGWHVVLGVLYLWDAINDGCVPMAICLRVIGRFGVNICATGKMSDSYFRGTRPCSGNRIGIGRVEPYPDSTFIGPIRQGGTLKGPARRRSRTHRSEAQSETQSRQIRTTTPFSLLLRETALRHPRVPLPPMTESS